MSATETLQTETSQSHHSLYKLPHQINSRC